VEMPRATSLQGVARGDPLRRAIKHPCPVPLIVTNTAMRLNIRLEKGEALGHTRALAVKQHDGPAWIIGMTRLSSSKAAILAQHEGDLHLPDLSSLTVAAAQLLARHSGALHLDSLEHVSDEGLLALIPHPNLWIPEDINERINRLCKTEKELLEDREDEEAESDEADGPDDDEEKESGDLSRASDEWYDESNEEAYYDGGAGIDAEGEGNGIRVSNENDFTRGSGGMAHKQSAMDELLGPLDRLVGIEDIKRTIRSVVALARVAQQRRRAGLSVAAASYHMAFFGPPGTGKTTVARITASILRDAGVLSQGHLVETDGQGMVAKYLGQTGHRVREIVDRSLGGVLFIDEAYSLMPREGGAGAFASEAISTLVPLLETHREDLVVILAGYEEEMNELFTANPGLRSRFAHHLVFPPMGMDQLQAVYDRLAAEHGYVTSTRFKEGVRYAIDRERRIRGQRFANARAVRTLFEATLRMQAERLAGLSAPSVTDLQALLLEDLPERLI
jgi:stage V sporulation protein K